MKDINEIMPKIPNMKWGALLNKKPTSQKVDELNKLLPHNGKWHTVIEEKNIFSQLMSTSRYCTLGEITQALYEVGGKYRRSM